MTKAFDAGVIEGGLNVFSETLQYYRSCQLFFAGRMICSLQEF